MFNTVPKAVYEKMFTILSTASDLSFFKTTQRAYYPRASNLTDPKFYPWAFMDASGYDPIERLRSPTVWEYKFTIPLVAMVFAEQGDMGSMVFATGDTDTIGILDVAGALGDEYWKLKAGFGISGVRDWTIDRVGVPRLLPVQQHLMNPYVRGIQMDFIFSITERDEIT